MPASFPPDSGSGSGPEPFYFSPHPEHEEVFRHPLRPNSSKARRPIASGAFPVSANHNGKRLFPARNVIRSPQNQFLSIRMGVNTHGRGTVRTQTYQESPFRQRTGKRFRIIDAFQHFRRLPVRGTAFHSNDALPHSRNKNFHRQRTHVKFSSFHKGFRRVQPQAFQTGPGQNHGIPAGMFHQLSQTRRHIPPQVFKPQARNPSTCAPSGVGARFR